MASHNQSYKAGEPKGQAPQANVKSLNMCVKQETAQAAKDKTSQTAEGAKDKAGQTGQAAKDKAGQAAKETGQAAKDKAGQTGQA
ncbi:hypothetical protein LWI29_001824 [Acer saccharum]|uniref:Uncharacterized protein n=1 Tax=Acer saccharum TaxID=4024 RepID=A0AA39SIM2_ACESA|nr:hypothetical protein LWI29_001824 [Acer saccharum]